MIFPRAVVFDLDQTLAESKSPITPEIADLLAEVLARVPVAITSGGKFEQLIDQAVEHLPKDAQLEQLVLLPTSGAALYTFDTKQQIWVPAYKERLSNEAIEAISAAIEEAVEETGVLDPDERVYGPRLENRGTQVAYSGIGQEAPVEAKKAWDPDRRKRTLLRDVIAKRLPDYEVKTGGSTTVDVTKRGINKAYGLGKLSERLDIPLADMLYIGDALYPGGNDEIVKTTDIQTRKVAGPVETAEVIRGLLADS